MAQPSLTCLTSPPGLSFGRPALMIGHPGHELRAFGWLCEFKPVCFVLTDGGRRGGAARLATTAGYLDACGAPQGALFGTLTDDEIYQAILRRDTALFCALADRLADALVVRDVDFVLADAAEYFNPTHDICRYLSNASIRMAERRTGRMIANFQLRLMENGNNSVDGPALRYRLGDALFAAKLDAAARFGALEGEVTEALNRFGTDHFREELFYAETDPRDLTAPDRKPHYETVGESRVDSGTFRAVIRYQDHVRDIREAIRAHADG